MKVIRSVVAGLLVIAQCLRMAACNHPVYKDSIMAPSFIASDSAVQQAGAMAGVVFAEMSNLQDGVVDAVANTMLSFLEDHGFNFEDPQHMNHLVSLMESMAVTEPAKKNVNKFMDEMKKMAVKAWHATKSSAKETAKEILLATLKGFLKESIKESLPILEKINEKALRSLPINIRVALAPIAYNMWLKFFEKTKIKLPPKFKIENFICKAIEKEKCDEIINKVKNNWAIKPAGEEIQDYSK